MILVDTSVWIEHFRRNNQQLKQLLVDDALLIHPFVVGELACGNLSKRGETLELLKRLPQAPLVTAEELLLYIERHDLFGKGLGLIDIHLLASAQLARARLWSLDKNLMKQAMRLKI